jgi:hypothetical protein
MEHFKQLSPRSVEATYSEQRLPHFRGNKLIEALPLPLSDGQLIEAMSSLPEYAAEQLEWTAHERIQLIKQLSHFSVPLNRHMELARKLDGMIREGYVGCDTTLLAKAMAVQKTIEFLKTPGRNYQTILRDGPQLSSLLMGIPGTGKTTATKRFLATFPKTIYHPELNLYQIPYLHIELPADGMSVKELCLKILTQIDSRIPGASYRETYYKLARRTTGEMLDAVSKILNIHMVGLLVADEVQNITNAKKGSQVLMTELVSMCNCLSVPILFIGTNKAASLFSTDFRQSRRATGGNWNNIENPFSPDASEATKGEWNDFAEILFQYQWVKKTVPFSEYFSRLLYEYSAGVLDIAIKLFAATQTRAILDKSEVITPELMDRTYREEFSTLHSMLEALRNGDLEKLAHYPDIAPTNLHEILQGIQSRLRAKSSLAFSVKRTDATFINRVATSLVASGHDEERSMEVAREVSEQANVRHLRDGVRAATKLLESPTRLTKPKNSKVRDTSNNEEKIEYETSDYRYAIQEALERGLGIFEQLQAQGLAKPLDELLEL